MFTVDKRTSVKTAMGAAYANTTNNDIAALSAVELVSAKNIRQ